MPKTTYYKNLLLNWEARSVAMPAAPTTFTGLFTVAPTAAGGGTEVSGDGYARQPMAGKFSPASNGSITNSSPIEYAVATGDGHGEVLAMGTFDAVSGGNLLRFVVLNNKKTIGPGDPAFFATGEIIFRG